MVGLAHVNSVRICGCGKGIMIKTELPQDFIELSCDIGSDPLLVQGAGGNSSCKDGDLLWIKASGTELADAQSENIFIAVRTDLALEELAGKGDGSCRRAMVNPDSLSRPSIETTFHAAIPHRYVFHYHSVASICHSTSTVGRTHLLSKLRGLNWVTVPYRKPGIPLTREILKCLSVNPACNIFVLENHGLVVAHDDVAVVRGLIYEIENRLSLPRLHGLDSHFHCRPVSGWEEFQECSWIAHDQTSLRRAVSGSYYPDHVVFLGPGLQTGSLDELEESDPKDYAFPAVLVAGSGIYLRQGSTGAEQAMLKCLGDVLSRLPTGWDANPIGREAEASLLNWDAEKHRRALAEGRRSQPK